MDIVEKNIATYINDALSIFEGDIGRLQQMAYDEGYPVISKPTARFLSTLLSAIKPKEILEIGCCIGFSSSLMSKFMKEGGHITTIDRYGIMIDEAKKNFKKLDIEDKITLIEGDAMDILPAMDKKFDFIFLDAAKGQYLQFLPHCTRMLNIGGVLMADDILQNGYVVMDRANVPRRQRTTHRRMREFLYAVIHAEGLESCILTCDNGIVMCTKTADTVVYNMEGFEYDIDFE